MAVTFRGTDRYRDWDGHVPALVRRAVDLAVASDFEFTVHPATGRLLAALAGGLGPGARIGETGTGCGAGVAWMASAAPVDTQIVSVEIDEYRAAAAAELLASDARVEVVCGESNELAARGPFDLLVLDAPTEDGPLHYGSVVPSELLLPNGVLVKDDLWPMAVWPPEGPDGGGASVSPEKEAARQRLLEHEDLFSTEITVAAGFAVLVARRRPPGAQP